MANGRFHFTSEAAELNQQVCTVIALSRDLGLNRGVHLNGEIITIKKLIAKLIQIKDLLEKKDKDIE